MRMRIVLAATAAMPIALMAFSTGPPTRRTGAGVDGGATCTGCHRTFAPANSDARGGVSITFDSRSYSPGVAQTIHVRVSHPEAARWGFELTARLVSDPAITAGTLGANSDVRVQCDNGGDAPCGSGVREFAEHRLAPRTAPGAGFTFDVPWTPPATDVGDIVFYFAGNAADGNGANTNDRIYTSAATLSAPCSLTAKPVIRTIADGAAFLAPWSPNGLLTVFGSGFTPAGRKRSAFDADFKGGRYPAELSCVAVEMAGIRVPIAYADSGQINVQAPTLGFFSGTVPVTIILNPGRPNEVRSDVSNNTALAKYAPALFTIDGTSVLAFGAAGGLIANSGGAPAKPGDTVSVYGTGFGYTNPVWQTGEVPVIASPLADPYTISIGGIAVPASDISYGGLYVNSISGVYQFVFRIPASAPNGDLPVAVTVGGVRSPDNITIPVKR